jgi:hypothetical protein
MCVTVQIRKQFEHHNNNKNMFQHGIVFLLILITRPAIKQVE